MQWIDHTVTTEYWSFSSAYKQRHWWWLPIMIVLLDWNSFLSMHITLHTILLHCTRVSRAVQSHKVVVLLDSKRKMHKFKKNVFNKLEIKIITHYKLEWLSQGKCICHWKMCKCLIHAQHKKHNMQFLPQENFWSDILFQRRTWWLK